MKKAVQTLLVAAVTCVTAVSAVYAAKPAEFPNRPVTFVVPYPPGGPTDAVARIVAQSMEAQSGQPFVVQNVPGGGSTIANTKVAGAEPDGYTLLWAGATGLVVAPHLYELRYDGIKSFSPIGMAVTMPYVLVAPGNTKYTDLNALIADAKARPGRINFGSPGLGTVPHLAVELFADTAGIELFHIPYKGGAQQMAGLFGGDLDLLIEVPSTVIPYAKEGRVKLLATTTSERLEELPDVPTLKELGLPDLEISGNFALMAPANTPESIRTYWNGLLNHALTEPEVLERIRAAGFYAMPSTPEKVAEIMQGEYDRWGKVIKDHDIRVQ